MKHKHHIIPRHSGGTDDPPNLILLTIPEHAEAHRKLYEEYGNEYDRIAWKCLSGQITNAEAHRAAHKERMTGSIPWNKGKTGIWTEEQLENNREKHRGKPVSQETRDKIADKHRGKKHSQERKDAIGAGNSKQFLVSEPGGEPYVIVNLREWSGARGVDQGNLIKYGKSKGFTAKKV